MSHKKKRRVAITGMGVVSPLGTGLHKFWRNLLAGKSGLGPVTLFDGSPEQPAAEVKDFDPKQYLTRKQIRCFPRTTQFAIAAAKQAFADAGLTEPYSSCESLTDCDVILGSSACNLTALYEQLENGDDLLQSFTSGLAGKIFMFSPACGIALVTGTRGYTTMVNAACPSGVNAIGLSAQRIAAGLSDTAVCGGVDTPINPIVMRSMIAANLILAGGGEPDRAVRPFDLYRTKSALGEGCGIFVLEELERARRRGARIYGEVAGFAQSMENVDEQFSIENSGRAWARTIRLALDRTRDAHSTVDYINAYGPGHAISDKIEYDALHAVFGRDLKRIPVSSIKGAVGSGLSTPPILSVVSACMALFTGWLPPTRNHEFRDAACSLNMVTKKIRRKNMKHVLVNSHGMGGVNTALVLRRVGL